ncbi:hypothetical protein NTE28_003575 [Vibrio harveyi]|nr:hypothetical protein [Vibrio harveyi]
MITNLIKEPTFQESMKNNDENAKTIGMAAITYEQNFYKTLDGLEGYNGGSFLWTKIDSFYYLFSFDTEDSVTASANYLETELTMDIASIYANLTLCSRLAFHYFEKENDLMAQYWTNAYHKLRDTVLDYLDENPECEPLRDVMKLID